MDSITEMMSLMANAKRKPEPVDSNKLEVGSKIQFLTGNDSDKIYTIISDLTPCARTEGCYTAKSDTGVTVYIFPSELIKFGYVVHK